jgi:hypothetical protein
MHQMWGLSEAGPQNLGLACTDNGLLLGRTSLIERRDGRFVVGARDEIERLLRRAYDRHASVDRLMVGLARIASALNANDQCLARIAAVHLHCYQHKIDGFEGSDLSEHDYAGLSVENIH